MIMFYTLFLILGYFHQIVAHLVISYFTHLFRTRIYTSRITLTNAQTVNKIERQRGKFIIAFLVVNIYELLYTVYSHDTACDTYDGWEKRQP